jgi:UDP-glucuronate 4-epimerase
VVVGGIRPDVLCNLQADELICHSYYNIYSMSVTGLRFFTVYGPWGRPDMAAYKFAINIMRGKPITIFQVRLRLRR